MKIVLKNKDYFKIVSFSENCGVDKINRAEINIEGIFTLEQLQKSFFEDNIKDFIIKDENTENEIQINSYNSVSSIRINYGKNLLAESHALILLMKVEKDGDKT